MPLEEHKITVRKKSQCTLYSLHIFGTVNKQFHFPSTLKYHS